MRIVYWHPIMRQSFIDPSSDAEFPVLCTDQSGWVLLQQIQAMPAGKPISFRDAWRLMFAEVHKQMRADNILGDEPGTSTWIMQNEVRWLTQQGYQILLTGEEFEFLEADEIAPDSAAA